jgi:hypothetical protein
MNRRPTVRWHRRLLLVALAAVIVPAGGCGALTTFLWVARGTDIDAEFNGLREKRVAVVCRPVAELEFRSQNAARDLAKGLNRLLDDRVPRIEMVDQRKVAEWVDNRGWDDYLEVGRALEADMVVAVELEQFSIYEGQTIYQGKAAATIKVYDCQTGEIAFERRLPRVLYPPNSYVPTSDAPESEFRREFVAVLADHVGRYFYRHDPHADVAMDARSLR